MKYHSLILGATTLLTTALVSGCAGEIPSSQDSEMEQVTQSSHSSGPYVIGEYKYEATYDDEVDSVDKTELWARVYAPGRLETGKRYPLLVFVHGYHGTCGDPSTVPRKDTNGNYRYQGECADGQVVVQSHAGYGYIAKEMARKGHLVVSINTNRGLSKNEAFERGRLILKHLEKLARWDQGREAIHPALGIDLRGHIDFDQVGLMGHSQGGRAVLYAYQLEQEDTIDWDARLRTDLKFRSIFEIAPVDAGADRDPIGVPVGVLLPLCDGDVGSLAGVKLFDRSMHGSYEWPGDFRATISVYGANHNYFNTEWQYSDRGSEHCPGQDALFQAETYRPRFGWYTEGVSGSELQQEVGKEIVSRFFLGTVGAKAQLVSSAMFDPLNPVPAEITDITPVERGFSPSTYAFSNIEFEDFQGETGVGPWGQRAKINGINVQYTKLSLHDQSYRGAHISWDNAHYTNVFEPQLTREGSGVNLTGYDTLDFRVEALNDSEHNLTDELNFAIRLVDGRGFVSTPVWVKNYVTLSGRDGPHSILQTVRIPLTDFRGLSLRQIRGVQFNFEDRKVPSGAIGLGSIRATYGGISSQ